MSARQRLTFAAIAVVIAVVAVIVIVSTGGGSGDVGSGGSQASATATATGGGSSSSSSSSSTGGAQAEAKPKPVTIVVRNGEPVGGIKKIKVNQGDRIAFTVKSDVADEVHVHGFDFHKDVAKGGSVSFSFPAKITGVFEVELEAAHTQLASLVIEP